MQKTTSSNFSRSAFRLFFFLFSSSHFFTPSKKYQKYCFVVEQQKYCSLVSKLAELFLNRHQQLLVGHHSSPLIHFQRAGPGFKSHFVRFSDPWLPPAEADVSDSVHLLHPSASPGARPSGHFGPRATYFNRIGSAVGNSSRTEQRFRRANFGPKLFGN